MSLSKLTIQYEQGQAKRFSGSIEALFNPTQLGYSRSVSWSPSYTVTQATDRLGFELKYQSVSPETLTLELFFDTYGMASTAGGGLPGALPLPGTTPRSVLPYTQAVAELASVDTQLHRPPVCRLRWGQQHVFQGVLQQASRTLQLFLEDGTPVRATLNCSFMEYPGDTGTANELDSADVAKKYLVRPGDTLMGIAAALYGDISRWRHIAVANGLDNPRRLTPGQTLSIPRIR